MEARFQPSIEQEQSTLPELPMLLIYTVSLLLLLSPLTGCAVLEPEPSNSIVEQDVTTPDYSDGLDEVEVNQIAAGAVRSLDFIHTIEKPESPYMTRITRLVNALSTGDGIVSLKVYSHPAIHIMSFPNDSYRIYTGLSDALNDAELQAIIVHEIAHVRLGHSRARIEQAVAIAAEDQSTGLNRPAVNDRSLEAAVGVNLMEQAYTRDQEREADTYTLSLLARNNLPIDSLAQALTKLYQLPQPQLLTSVHPGVPERIVSLKGESAAFGRMLDPAQVGMVTGTSASQALLEQARREEAGEVSKPTLASQAEVEDHCTGDSLKLAYPNTQTGWYVLSQPFSNKFDAELQTLDIQSLASDYSIVKLGKQTKTFHILVGPFYKQEYATKNYQEFVQGNIISRDACTFHLKGKDPARPTKIEAEG